MTLETEVAQSDVTPADDLDAVFNAALSSEETNTPGDETTPAPAATPAADVTPDVAPVVEAAPAAEAAPAVETATPVVAPAVQPEAAAAGSTDAPATPEAEAAPVTLESFLTDEEKTILAEYDSEWGEVSKAERIRTDAAIRHARHTIYTELNDVLAPLFSFYREAKVKEHVETIQKAHGDYATLVPAVQAWVAGQPAILRDAYAGVLATGTAAQVVELYDAYKKANGIQPAVPVPATENATAKPPVVTQPAQRTVPPAVIAAAAATAPVGGVRSTVSVARDSSDEGAAWAEALTKV